MKGPQDNAWPSSSTRCLPSQEQAGLTRQLWTLQTLQATKKGPALASSWEGTSKPWNILPQWLCSPRPWAVCTVYDASVIRSGSRATWYQRGLWRDGRSAPGQPAKPTVKPGCQGLLGAAPCCPGEHTLLLRDPGHVSCMQGPTPGPLHLRVPFPATPTEKTLVHCRLYSGSVLGRWLSPPQDCNHTAWLLSPAGSCCYQCHAATLLCFRLFLPLGRQVPGQESAMGFPPPGSGSSSPPRRTHCWWLPWGLCHM